MASFTVTVFGGTGFLGRRIVNQLADAGMKVRIASRHPRRPVGTDPENDALEHVEADVHDPESIRAALREVDAAVNAVSLYVEKGGRDTFEQVHVKGAERVAQLARETGVKRLVHISGLGIDPNSDSAYVRARTEGDIAVRKAFPEVTMLRPSVLFGPDDAFLSAVSMASKAPVIPLFGKGRTRLQPVYVDDVARAVRAALQQEGAIGEIYELGGPDVLSYRAVVRRVLAHLHRHRPLLPWPFWLWRLQAAVLGLLPNPPLTRDQVILMEKDNRVGDDAKGFRALDLEPRSLGSLLDECLGTA